MKKPNAFRLSKAAENDFARALKKVARVSGHIVEPHIVGFKKIRRFNLRNRPVTSERCT